MAISTDRSLRPVYDPGVMAGFVEGDEELAASLRAIFTAQASADMQVVAQAVKAEDWAQLIRIAHKLKTSSRTVGALAVADYCERLDQPDRISAEVARVLGARLQAGIGEALMAMKAGGGGQQAV
ncbi:MAG: Hpt domain-containing protein [Gammaproteobacteria bacterium]